MPEESLAAFKTYITLLFSVNIADPNVGVTFADDALAAIGSYASNRTGWSEFASRCDALLKEGGREA